MSVLPRVPPAGSVTLYRAFAACHVAGATLGVLGLATAADSVAAVLRGPLLAAMVVQLVVGVWLLRCPMLIPQVMLGRPRATWWVGVLMTLAVAGAATSYAAFPSTLAAACWVSTAAAVGPRRSWPLLGAALALGVAAIWWLVGAWDTSISGESVWVGLAQLGPVFLNGAWMGAAGSAAAWRLRRWGVIVAADNGALRRLRGAGEQVREAAEAVLRLCRGGRTADEAIAAGQLGQSAIRAAEPATKTLVLLSELTAGLQVPFAIETSGDDQATMTAEQWIAVRGAVLRHLSNVLRHATAARCVWIGVSHASQTIRVTFEDDGGGHVPGTEQEGEGSRLSRDALEGVGGGLRYLPGGSGVRLELWVPDAPGVDVVPTQLGLAAEVRGFFDLALRNNRLVSWIVPVPPMLWAFGVDWWVSAVFLAGGLVCELVIRQLGPSRAERSSFLPLALCGGIAVALAALLSVAVTTTSIYPAAAATSYPIIEVAWRGRWRLWGVLELARAAAVVPWVLEFGAASIVSAYIFPLAATVIVIGGERLVRRADELDRGVGTVLAWRELQVETNRDAGLRHDVVRHLQDDSHDNELASAVSRLDQATAELAALQQSVADPVVDAVETARNILAPVPVGVVGSPGVPLAASSDSFHVSRRLERLNAVADGALRLLEANPSRWNGARRLRGVRLTFVDQRRGQAICLEPEPHGAPVEVRL